MGYAQITTSLPLRTIQSPPSATQVLDLTWVDAYWANFLGATPEQFCNSRQTQIVESANITGPWAFARQGNWLVVLPNGWQRWIANHPTMEAVIQETFRPGTLPKPARLQTFFADFPIVERFGPALVYLHAAPTPLAVDGVSIRPLTVRDQLQVTAFAATTAIPWDLNQPTVWKKVFGLFVNEQLVASCAMRVWGELLAEVYVDTAPAYRCRGYGKAVTRATLQWIHTSTPYYAESVVELANPASVKLLSRLGGMPYGYVIMSF